MKTETKSKIKKALKVGAYVGGLMLALVLGMGFGSCSEKKVQNQTSLKAEPKKLSPRLSLDDADNIMGHALTYQGVVVGTRGTASPATGFATTDWQCSTYLVHSQYMPVGHTYVLTFDGYWNSNYGTYLRIVGAANGIKTRLDTEGYSTDLDLGLFSFPNFLYEKPYGVYVFSLPSDFYRDGPSGTGNIRWFSLACNSNITGLYLVEDYAYIDNASSVCDISFSKTSWFPYQLLGQNNSPVIAGPYNGGTMDTKEKGITDVLFSSNGRLFKGILFSFAPLAQVGSTASQQRHPSTYGYYNQDMTPIGTPQECHSDYLWYLAQVDYIPIDGGPFVYVGGQRMKQFSDYSQSVTQFFDWVDNRYADISIKWAGSALNTEITTTSGLTNLQWLENIASSVFDNTISLGGGSVDVFSLIGNGFSSITSILNVQILPYLTLGTLLLAPLVILLALAILKVLNK